MKKIILGIVFLAAILIFTGCRTYNFELQDPDTGKTIRFSMQHSLSNTSLGRATFTKNAEGLWQIEIESLETEQKLVELVQTLVAASKVATPVP